jgi:hypothetical protein
VLFAADQASQLPVYNVKQMEHLENQTNIDRVKLQYFTPQPETTY